MQNILKNEKYTGNALLGKTFKPDVLSKSRLRNEGQAPSYYVKNSHPAIISQEVFDLAQAELNRRKTLRSNAKTGEGKYSSLYVLSGLLICSECGSKFRRYGRSLASGERVVTWVCITHQKYSISCKMLPLKEKDIFDAYKRVAERLSGDLSEITQTVRNNIESEFNSKLRQSVSEYEDEIARLQDQVLELFKNKKEGTIFADEYDNRYREYSGKIMELQSKQSELQKENLAAQLTKQRLVAITEILSNKNIEITDETIMKNLIEHIKVISKHEIEFQFKCGINTIEKM